MKKIIFSISLVLIVLVTHSQSQFGIGAGFGAANRFPVVQLALSYDMPVMGIRTGYLCATNNEDPCYFYAALQKSIRCSDWVRVAPYIGGYYALKSNDNKALNYSRWLVGAEVRHLIGYQTVLYLNVAGSDKAFFSTIGVQLLLSNNNCR